jgi:hypothetical protein
MSTGAPDRARGIVLSSAKNNEKGAIGVHGILKTGVVIVATAAAAFVVPAGLAEHGSKAKAGHARHAKAAHRVKKAKKHGAMRRHDDRAAQTQAAERRPGADDPAGDDRGQVQTEAGDDRGQAAEPGDDRGAAAEPGDDYGQPQAEPGDDRAVSTPTATDDRGGHGGDDSSDED